MAQFQKHKILRITLTVFILGAVLFVFAYFNPLQHSFFYTCPIQKTTGYLCAGCGAQRALHQLLHFNFFEAFKLNPLFVISLPFLLFGIGVKVWNLIFETKHRIFLFNNNKFIVVSIIVILVFAILRNIPYEPFNILAPVN